MPAACAERASGAPSGCAPRLVPFAPPHLLALHFGDTERAILGGADLARCADHWPARPAWSLVDGGGVLGCGGFIETGADAIAWVVLSDRLRARRFALHRAAKRVLTAAAPRYRRIRATAHGAVPAAHRWLRALGFRPVRPLPGYGPAGETFMEYER